MRSNCFNKALLPLFVIVLISCGRDQKKARHYGHESHASDSSVMAAARGDESGILANVATVQAEGGKRILSVELSGVINYDTRKQSTVASRVAGRIERLHVRYNYQRVRKGQLLMEIYSPELSAAQRELIFLRNSNDVAMYERAVQRLELLGMKRSEIEQVAQSGNILYRVAIYSNTTGYIVEQALSTAVISEPSGNSQTGNMSSMEPAGREVQSLQAPASRSVVDNREVQLREGQYVNMGQPLFKVYQGDAYIAEFAISQEYSGKIVKGQKILFYPQSQKNLMQQATISLVEPVYRNGTTYNIARIYIGGQNYQVGQLVTARVPVVYSSGWWLPKKAVWLSGSKAVVFRKEKAAFYPVEIETAASVNEQVLVKSDIQGWNVASNAYYLVDSESFVLTNSTEEKYEE